MKKSESRRKHFRLIPAAALIGCLAVLLTPRVSAVGTFNKLETHDFRSETETVYTSSRSKQILSSGASQWKLTESGDAVMNRDGLTVPAGTIALYGSNPLTYLDDFRLEAAYSTSSADGDGDGAKAFMYISAESFGKSMTLNDLFVTLSVAENGDVYMNGDRINHSGGAPAEDTLTARNPKIAEGTECVLTVTYESGRLSVTLSYGGTKRELVSGYQCTITGLRQMQFGGDKTSSKRIENITYKTITFYEYGEYVPDSSVKAIVQTGTGIKEYTSAESAFDAVRSGTGAKLQLYSDVTLSKPVRLEKNASFTLDLNGYTVNRNTGGRKASDGYVFLLGENSSLTVTDSAPERENYSSGIKGGVITGGAGSSIGGCFQLSAGSSLTMNGGSVVNCVSDDHGGAIRVAGGRVRVNLDSVGFYCNMTLDSTDNCHGGAIYEDYDDCVITAVNCIFEGNYSEDNGGAVYVNEGKFIAQNCYFTGNQSKDDGGAVYLESDSYATLDGCTFHSNRADGDGGAVYCNSSDGTRLTGEYKYNSAKGDGGAIYVNGDSVSISDAEVTENTAGGHGSGIFVDEMYDLSVQGLLRIRDNYSTKNVRDNVYLDDFGITEAHIYNGGLDEGSEVWIRTGDSDHTVSDNISEYQKKYFWQDDSAKSFSFTADESRTENTKLVTSAIGEGSLAVIFIFIAIMIAAIAAAGIAAKKKKEDTDNEE